MRFVVTVSIETVTGCLLKDVHCNFILGASWEESLPDSISRRTARLYLTEMKFLLVWLGLIWFGLV